MSSVQDYEVVWTGAMEADRIRTERARMNAAPRRLRHDHTDAYMLVLWFLVAHPRATVRNIQAGTCLSIETVNYSLCVLLKRGAVARSHRQIDDRSRPVEWWAVEGMA